MQNKIVKIKTIQENTASNGNKYHKLTLEDENKINHNAMIWDCKNPEDLGVNNQIKILSSKKDARFNNHTISAFELIKKGKLGLTVNEQDLTFEKLTALKLTEDFNLSELDSLKLNWIKNLWLEYQDLIKKSPAAMNHHHNYIGGLLVHCDEMINFIIDNRPSSFSDSQFLNCIIAILLHDLGKIFEYKIDENGIISYNEEFKQLLNLDKREKLSPHILWGYNLAMQNDMPEVAHIVGSHHYIPEHGAMFTPMTPEAWIIFMADYWSSRFGKVSVEDLDEEG